MLDLLPQMSHKALSRQQRGPPFLASPMNLAPCFAHPGCWLMSTERQALTEVRVHVIFSRQAPSLSFPMQMAPNAMCSGP